MLDPIGMLVRSILVKYDGPIRHAPGRQRAGSPAHRPPGRPDRCSGSTRHSGPRSSTGGSAAAHGYPPRGTRPAIRHRARHRRRRLRAAPVGGLRHESGGIGDPGQRPIPEDLWQPAPPRARLCANLRRHRGFHRPRPSTRSNLSSRRWTSSRWSCGRGSPPAACDARRARCSAAATSAATRPCGRPYCPVVARSGSDRHRPGVPARGQPFVGTRRRPSAWVPSPEAATCCRRRAR
jgi:hypothetical protein